MSQLETASLVEKLDHDFTLDDLRRLCLVLGVDYENLPGDTKVAKARELVLYFERRQALGRLKEFVDSPKPARPYPGLAPFSAQAPRFFYGRDSEIQYVLQHLRLQHFLLVVGPSGSGKSSLLRAGVLPRLDTSTLFPQGFWHVRVMRPGSQPLQELAHSLDATSPAAPSSAAVAALLAAQPPAQRFLLVVDQFEEVFAQTERAEQARFIAALKDLRALDTCAVLVAMRADFYPDLMNSDLWPIDPAQRLEIAPLRGEALRQAIQRPAMDVGVYVEPGLVERLLADAADEPGTLPLLQETMVLLWEQMAHRLLPLSAYLALGTNGRSGLAVAIATRADATLASLSDAQRGIARRIFLRLIQFGQGRADTRRQQTVAELCVAGEDSALFDQTLRRLTDNRLLTLRGEENDTNPRVDIAHESLIVAWPTLQGWLRERRAAEQTRRRLEGKAEEWVRLGRGQGGLLDAAELPEAERWLVSPDAADLGYDTALSDLVQASRLALAAEAAQRRQATRLRLALLGAVVAAVIAALSIALWSQGRFAQQQASAAATAEAFGQEQQRLKEQEATARANAEQQNRLATSRQLAAQALTYMSDRLDLASLLSLAAFKTADTVEARGSLLSAVEQEPHLTAYLHGHEASVSSLALSPDGRLLASGSCHLGAPDNPRGRNANCQEGGPRRGVVQLWDLATQTPLGPPLEGHRLRVTSLAFSPDGKLLASASEDKTIILWDVATRRPLGMPLTGHTDQVNHIVFSPDGRWLASGSADHRVILWDVATRQAVGSPFTAHTKGVRRLAFSPDGRWLASASDDKTVVLWDVAAQQAIHTLAGHTDSVLSVAFSPNGTRLATGGGEKDHSILLWDVATGQRLAPALASPIGTVPYLSFLDDDTLLTGGWGGATINQAQWKFSASRWVTQSMDSHTTKVWTLAVSADGRTWASGHESGVIALWDMGRSTRLAIPLARHSGGVRSLAFNPAGTVLASGSDDKTILLWDVAARQPLGPALQGHRNRVRSVAFSPDGQTLAAGDDDGMVILWDMATRQALGPPLAGHTGPVASVAFSRDGKLLASGSEDRSIVLWDVATRQPLTRLQRHTNKVRTVAFSPDGKTLVSAGDDVTILLWDIATRQPRPASLTGHALPVYSLVFRSDGGLLASSGDDGAVLLWDTATWRQLGQPLDAQQGHVNSVAFSPDGQVLAAGYDPDQIILWDVATRRRLGGPLRAHRGALRSVVFSPDGQTLASGGDDRAVYLWDVGVPSWQTRACRLANRNLTRAEWAEFLGPVIPYAPTCPDLPVDAGARPGE